MSSSNSRPKGNSKKTQQVVELQKRIQSLIRQNLQLDMTIKKLTNNAIQIKTYQKMQKQQHEKDISAAERQIECLKAFNQAQTDQILMLTKKKDQYEIRNGCLSYELERLKKAFEEQRQLAKQQYDDLKRYAQSQAKKHQAFLSEYHIAIKQRVEYLSQNQSLQAELSSNTQQQKRQIADKDREKLQTIDIMKREMHEKMKDLKNHLLSMRRDQMATNTRLTVLQNHQLLQELEYQSKNTEKILKINTELERKVNQLIREIQVEKEIAEQLAKRSSTAKRIIKNLTQRIASLQKEIENHQELQQITKDKNKKKTSPLKQLSGHSSQQVIKALTKTVQHLESQLTKSKQLHKKTQQEKSHFQQLYQQNHSKYEYYLKGQSDLRLLMIRFLSCALEGQNKGDENSGEYDIQRLKDKDVKQWSKSDVVMTVRMLLTFLKPHFTLKNMKTDFLRHQKWQIMNNEQSIDELIHSENATQDINTQINPKIKYPKRLNYPKIKSLSSSNLHTIIQQPYTKPINNSTNISPSKDYSLYSVLQDQKRKSLSRQHKNFSQHNLSHTKSGQIQRSLSKHSMKKDMKENIEQRHEFRPEQFLRKEKNGSKLLPRANIRDWGKKVQITAKGAFLVKQK